VVTIFRLGGAHPEFFASAPSLAEASALLPDGAYTTLRTYGHGTRVLRLAQHLARLREPTASGPGSRFEDSKVRAGLVQALKAAGSGEARLRLTCANERLFVAVEPLEPLPETLYRDGVWCVSVPLKRTAPKVKDTRFIPVAQAAYRDLPPGVHEGLMVADDGTIVTANHVIAGATIAFRPKVLVRFNVGVVTACHVIRDEIDQRLHVIFVNSFQQRFEFAETFVRLFGVIGTNVEIILDGVRAAPETFEQIGIIGGLADLRIISRSRLLQDPG